MQGIQLKESRNLVNAYNTHLGILGKIQEFGTNLILFDVQIPNYRDI